MENIENQIITGYKISTSTEITNKLYGITPLIQEKLTEMSIKVQKKKNSAIKELNDLIKKYPTIPQFKNLLSVLYNAQGNGFMANQINSRIVSLHPDYLFSKLNLANTAIEKEEFDNVPEILGELMELKALYPERVEFHFGEVIGFYQTAFYYFLGIKNAKQAQICLDIIDKLNNEFDLGLNMFEFRRRLMLLNLDEVMTKFENEETDSFNVEAIPVKIVEPTTEAPVFENELIEVLYHNDLNIDQEIINQILLLPRASLVSDLHKIIYDSMARHTVFTDDMEWSPTTHEFFIHALSIMADLKDESSLDVIFDILRQDEEYLNVWLNDYLTDDFCEIVYHLAKDKLEKLRSFVFESNRYLYSRTLISSVLLQVALHEPKRRAEVINWYKSVIEEIIDRKEDETIIDSEWIAFIVSDLVDLQAIELTAQITELFYHGMAFESICGSLNHCMEDLASASILNHKRAIFENTPNRYKHYLAQWEYYAPEKPNTKPTNVNEEKTDPHQIKSIAPNSIEKPKAGRNDPCPCGSGKKYKKCCL
jgi:hypothetical protein